MSVWHGDQRKKKLSGGRKRAYRVKRNYEKGSFPIETILGNQKKKISVGRGGNIKIKALRDKWAFVTNPKNGETKKTEIVRVVRNPANTDYDRRGVITKGATVETSIGLARITSRPGQDGMVNGILISDGE